jgi:hypothetical protein
MLNGKTLEDNMQSYQAFSNIESNVKHARAHCKGSVYWLDYDLDCPGWFKAMHGPYYETMCGTLNEMFGKGNYAIIDTSGGYHILVRTAAIHGDPHKFCGEMRRLYDKGLALDKSLVPHVDIKGNDKFECIVNDSQIPGIPMPGTFQYGRPVRVINKEEFSSEYVYHHYKGGLV